MGARLRLGGLLPLNPHSATPVGTPSVLFFSALPGSPDFPSPLRGFPVAPPGLFRHPFGVSLSPCPHVPVPGTIRLSGACVVTYYPSWARIRAHRSLLRASP